MPLTLWAPTEPTSDLTAPVPRIPPVGIKKWQSSTKPEKGIQGTEKDEEEEEKKEKVLFRRNTKGTDRYCSSSSSSPAAKSDKEATKKEQGRGLETNSVLVTNSGH